MTVHRREGHDGTTAEESRRRHVTRGAGGSPRRNGRQRTPARCTDAANAPKCDKEAIRSNQEQHGNNGERQETQQTYADRRKSRRPELFGRGITEQNYQVVIIGRESPEEKPLIGTLRTKNPGRKIIRQEPPAETLRPGNFEQKSPGRNHRAESVKQSMSGAQPNRLPIRTVL